MPFLAIFAVVALAEMATFFWVESRIGLGWALGLALATAVIGSVLVRRSGLAILAQIRGKLDQGQLPGRELTHGAAVLVAGAFLISPGFITDTLGFLLLVPPIRDWIHGSLTRRFQARFSFLGGGVDEEIIDVEDIDPPQL